jgi:hypothetical protein
MASDAEGVGVSLSVFDGNDNSNLGFEIPLDTNQQHQSKKDANGVSMYSIIPNQENLKAIPT